MNRLFLIGSCPEKQFYIEIPKIDGNFTGTGDLFAAILIGNIQKVGFESACNRSASALKSILEKTTPGNELQIPKHIEEITNPAENLSLKPLHEMLLAIWE
jgi:pyridoxal/pyridoxine/pyridoxamine kinase